MTEHRIGITFDTGGTEGDLSDIGKVLEDVAKGGKKAQDELKRTSQALREQGGAANQVAASLTNAAAKVAQFKNSSAAGLRSAARDGEQAAAAIHELEARIAEVKATGGPVPKQWTASVKALTAAVDDSTRAHARSRAAMEAQKRSLSDATRAAGGFRDRMDMADMLGAVNPKLETLALKGGLIAGAFFVAAQALGKVGEIVTQLGASYNIRGLDDLGASLQSIASLDFAKAGQDLGRFWATVRDAPVPQLQGKGAAYMPTQEARERLAKQISDLRKAEAEMLAEWNAQKTDGIAANAVLAARAEQAAQVKDALNALGQAEKQQTGDLAAGWTQMKAVADARRKADQDAKQASDEAKRAAESRRLEEEKLAKRSGEVVTSLKLQLEAEQRLTEAYIKGPKAVKALTKELELEAAMRQNLANVSPKDAPFVVMLTMALQRARELNAEAKLFAERVGQFQKLNGIQNVGPVLDPINSAPSLAAAKRSSFFDAIGISEADFRKAHETAQQWRDREIAAVRAAAGDNLDLVQEREQAILDIQRAYAEEMVNAAQTILSNVRGMLSSLQALGINIKGAQKPLGQAQAGMDLYQQGAGAYKAYQSSSLAGSGVGTVAIMAAAVLIISNWYAQRGSAKSTATIGSKNDGELMWDYRNNPMGRDTIEGVKKAVQEAIRFATDFIKGLGGDFKAGAANVNGVTIGSDGRGKGQTWFVQLANGQIVQFEKDMDAALQYAAIQAVKFAPVGGLDPIVAAAIQKSMAMTVDKFQADVMAAMAVSQLPLSSEGVGFTQSLQGLHSLQEQMTSLLGPTFELADAIRNITSAMEDTIEAERKRLLGIKAIEDFTKRLTDAQSFNTKIEQERARILAEIAKQEAAMAQAYAQANQIQRPGVDGGVPGSQMGPGIPGRDPILPSSVNEAQYAIQALMDQLAGLGDILNLDDVKKGIKDDILGNLYQFLEGNKKYAAEILAWKRKELEMTFEQYKMQLILLGMWDEATQGIWQAALAAGIKGLTKPGNSGGSNRATGIQGAKDAVNDYNLSKLGPAQQALADINKKWDEHAKAAKGNADLLKKIADARKDEIEQILKQAAMSYRRDKQAFLGKDGGALGQGLQGINDQANELVARARDLYKAGKLTKEEFQKARDAIRDAAAEHRQDMVNSTANNLFMELYGLLGMDKEAAQLKYDLTMAELNIKYQELAIAVEKYKLEGKFLPELQALIDKVKLAGPGIFGPPANDPGGYGGGGGLQDMSDEIERVVKALKEFRDSLLLDDQLSPLTPQQRLDEARRQYEETLRLAQGGNLEAASGLPDIARTFLEIFQEYTGGGGAYAALAQQILAQVRALEERLGGVPHYAQGGIVSHPHLAMVGDGGPEAIIPLKNGFIPSQPQGGDNARLIIGFFGKVPRTLESIDSHLANIDDRLSSPFDRVAAIESRKVRQAGRG